MSGHIYTSLYIGELERVLLSDGVTVNLTPHKSTQTNNLRILYECMVNIYIINTSVASDIQKRVLRGTYWTSCIEILVLAGLSIIG